MEVQRTERFKFSLEEVVTAIGIDPSTRQFLKIEIVEGSLIIETVLPEQVMPQMQQPQQVMENKPLTFGEKLLGKRK